MTNEEKEIKEAREDVEERLRLSNKKLWQSLPEEKRKEVVEKYINIIDEANKSIFDILEKDFLIRQQFAFLLIGLLLGIVGNLFTDAFSTNLKKLTGEGFLYVTLCFVAFYLGIKLILRFMNTNSGENLRRNKVLEKLIDLLNKD